MPLYPAAARIALTLLSLGYATAAHCQAKAQPEHLPFAISQLSGWWAESYSPTPACDKANVRTRQVFSKDGKQLRFVFDRPWKTELGLMTEVDAVILSASEHTLVIRYEKESRLKQNGQPVEWELSMAAPGVYRWRETDWKAEDVNTVVGIRCSEL